MLTEVQVVGNFKNRIGNRMIGGESQGWGRLPVPSENGLQALGQGSTRGTQHSPFRLWLQGRQGFIDLFFPL